MLVNLTQKIQANNGYVLIISKLCSDLYLFFGMINTSYIKKIQAEEKEVYGRKAKEKNREKPENKIKKY